jgi:hypothetical protein
MMNNIIACYSKKYLTGGNVNAAWLQTAWMRWKL